MRTATMIRRTLAMTAVIALAIAVVAAAAPAVPVDRGREPARATVKPAYRVAKGTERRAMNRAKGLPRKRARFAWRVGTHRPRHGFVCVKRGSRVYGVGLRRRMAASKRWRTWNMHVYATQSYGQHCAQIFSTRVAQGRAR